MNIVENVSRRDFFKVGSLGAAGLVIGFYLSESSRGLAQAVPDSAAMKLNAFIHIAPDDTVTFFIHKSEMGQGTVTSLSMLLAEELECDWKKIKTEFAPVDRAFGGLQGVFGSNSVRSSWDQLRKAGATAREMLMEAAAKRWGVEKSACQAENSFVINTISKERLSYGSVAVDASKLAAPGNVTLKEPAKFKLIGKPTKRLDTPDKTNGKAIFGIDVRVPGMLFASVERCPVFGGKVAKFDGAKARAVAGVKDVVQISSGIAVIADSTWSAFQGRYALEIEWDEGANAELSSASIRKHFLERAGQPALNARKEGDASAAMETAVKKIEAVYEAPYLAHAPMEPSSCTAHVRADGCDVWAPTQMQTGCRTVAAQITGLGPEKINIHTTMLGGGFGRRILTDFVTDAVETSKAAGKPVQVTWTREDETQHSSYRPASYCTFKAGLDAEGWPVAWANKIVCQPLFANGRGVDGSSVEGARDIPYSIPNILVEYNAGQIGIPVTFWRSVGHSQNTFFSESFIDEVAAAGGKDPFELRRRLLQKMPRHLAVLELAAEKAGWGKPLPEGRARGIALVLAFGTYVAHVAEVSVSKQGQVKIHRIVSAVDCGRPVNPAGITQQVEGAIAFGLSAALKGEITIDKGRVQQSNFSDYDILRMDEMPVVEVHIIPSEATPSGMGEPAVPPAAPAVCNAIFKATGKRIRRLPIRPEDLV